LRFTTFLFDCSFVMLVHPSNRARCAFPASVSFFRHKVRHIDRCKNSPSAEARQQNYCCISHSSQEFRTGASRVRQSQATSAELFPDRSGFSTVQAASESRRSRYADSISAAGMLTRPVRSRGPRISFTKTSPQQTDPPARWRKF